MYDMIRYDMHCFIAVISLNCLKKVYKVYKQIITTLGYCVTIRTPPLSCFGNHNGIRLYSFSRTCCRCSILFERFLCHLSGSYRPSQKDVDGILGTEINMD